MACARGSPLERGRGVSCGFYEEFASDLSLCLKIMPFFYGERYL